MTRPASIARKGLTRRIQSQKAPSANTPRRNAVKECATKPKAIAQSTLAPLPSRRKLRNSDRCAKSGSSANIFSSTASRLKNGFVRSISSSNSNGSGPMPPVGLCWNIFACCCPPLFLCLIWLSCMGAFSATASYCCCCGSRSIVGSSGGGKLICLSAEEPTDADGCWKFACLGMTELADADG